jgi:hypothetical protein
MTSFGQNNLPRPGDSASRKLCGALFLMVGSSTFAIVSLGKTSSRSGIRE